MEDLAHEDVMVSFEIIDPCPPSSELPEDLKNWSMKGDQFSIVSEPEIKEITKDNKIVHRLFTSFKQPEKRYIRRARRHTEMCIANKQSVHCSNIRKKMTSPSILITIHPSNISENIKIVVAITIRI